MLRIEMVIGVTTYYFASEPLDYNNKYHQSRIINPYEIQRIFSYSDKTGSRKRTCGVRLSNADQFFNSIESTNGLLNQKFTLYYQDGAGSTQKMVGKCTNINGFGPEVDLTISEIGFEYLTDPIPDAGIAYDYYSEFGVNDNWNTIPICIGTCNRVGVMWADRVNSRFLICSGPIKAIKKVYFDKTLVYDSVTLRNGYKPTPTSQNIKIRAFRGSGATLSPEVVGGVTSSYPGFAYLELYDGDTGLPVEPILSDGSIGTIFVDIEGITDLTDSFMERNPASVIYQLLTNARTGYRGFGLGVSVSDVDFTSAIAECAAQGFVIDGIINQKNDAGIWFDELVKTCRGSLVEVDGKTSLIIDTLKSSVEAAFDEAGEVGYNCNLEPWSEPPLEQQINRLRIFYDMNHESGTWNKSPDFNEESWCKDPNLKNSTHATRVMKWNTNTLEMQFLKDDTAAHKLGQYYFKRDILQLKTVSFVTESTIPSTLDAGSLITITASKYGWSAKQFLIQEITRTDGEIRIKAKEYDPAIFTFTAITPGTDPIAPTNSPYEIPSKPTITGISNTAVVATDGTVQSYLCACICKASNAFATLFYRKPVGCPDSSFSFFGRSYNNSLVQVWDETAGCYNIRAVSVSSSGVYSDIAIEAGDKHYYGQPGAESYVNIIGDTAAPNVPIPAAAAGLASISLAITFAGGKPADFDHFQIKRRRSDGCYETTVSEQWRSTVFVDNDPFIIQNYTDEFQYSVSAIDSSGNASSFSSWTSATKAIQVATKDITANQIIGKDFRTTCGVGDGCCISGIRFDATSIRGYCENTLNFCLNASNGLLFAQNACISGNISATTGNIGGFCVLANMLCSTPAAGCSVGISSCSTSGEIAFWAGCSTPACAPFRVTNLGAMVALSGCIGGWEITSTGICKSNLHLLSTGCLYTNDYVSGLRGWKIGCDGSAEFNNAVIRGAIRSSSFTYDEINTVGGQLFVANSANLFSDATTANAIGNCFNICVSHRSVYSQIFSASDVLRFKTFNGTNVHDIWATVVSYTCQGSHGIYLVQLKSGSTAVEIPKGTTVVSYGSAATTSGGLFLNGQGTCSPYIDVFQSNTTPWVSVTPKVRLGRLDGIAGMPVNTFGLWTNNGCIVGGTIQSTNWCATAGSCIDLATGTFAFGGSSAPNLCWNGTLLQVTGTVCANCGCIGGFAILCDKICSTNCLIGMSNTCLCLAFWAGCCNASCAPFRVTHLGALVASSATITGTICATAGLIGGFGVCANCLYSVPAAGCSVGMSSCTTSGAIAFWAGCSTVASAPFRVTNTGVLVASNATISGTLYATAGTIGGFCIGTNMLCSTPAAGCSVGMSSCTTSGCVSFWAGCSTVTSAPFRVTNLGCLYAICGRIGAWRMDGNFFQHDIYYCPGDPRECYSYLVIDNYAYCGVTDSSHKLEMGTSVRCCTNCTRLQSYLQIYSPMNSLQTQATVKLIGQRYNTCTLSTCEYASIDLSVTGCSTDYIARLYKKCACVMTVCTDIAIGIYSRAPFCAFVACTTGDYGFIATSQCFGVHAGVSCAVAVQGCSMGDYGVRGWADRCLGVVGVACCAFGVCGYSWKAYGVYGYSLAAACAVAGNTGYNSSSSIEIKHILDYVNVIPLIRNIRIPKYVYQDRNGTGFDSFIGPISEDIQREFGLTFGNDSLYTVDGIALKGVQELDSIVQKQESCISDMNCCILSLNDRLSKLESLIT